MSDTLLLNQISLFDALGVEDPTNNSLKFFGVVDKRPLTGDYVPLKNGKFIIPIVIPPHTPYYELLKTNSKFFAYFTLGLKGVLKGCYVSVFEYGEVYGGNWKVLFHNFKSFTRKFGQWQDLVKISQKWFQSIASIHPYRIAYRYYHNAPRKKSFEGRMFLKSQLPKKYRRLYRIARQIRGRFIPTSVNNWKLLGENTKPKGGFKIYKKPYLCFLDILSNEEILFLRNTFGSAKRFYLMCRYPGKIPSVAQSALNDFL